MLRTSKTVTMILPTIGHIVAGHRLPRPLVALPAMRIVLEAHAKWPTAPSFEFAPRVPTAMCPVDRKSTRYSRRRMAQGLDLYPVHMRTIRSPAHEETIVPVFLVGSAGSPKPRHGRGSPHHALDALAAGIVGKKVNWVLDADFSDYFSSLDHQWLERFLEHRIADRRVLRLIQKWLAAGVIENGSWTAFEEGVPQGASVSPLLRERLRAPRP